MLSKLLEADAAAQAQPIVWQTVRLAPDSAATAGEAAHCPRPETDAGAAANVVINQQRRIQQLEQELEQQKTQCYQDGFAAGQRAGAQQAAQELEPVLVRMARTIEEMTTLRGRARAEAEEDAVRLAIAVARKILHREFSVDPEALLGLVKAALQRIDARELHRLRFHPADVPALERHLQANGMPARLEVHADPNLERGSAIFETARGTLDASISTQLQEIERGFIDVVRRNRDAL